MNWIEKQAKAQTDAPKLWSAVCDAIKTSCQTYQQDFPSSLANVDWENGINNQLKIVCSVGQGHNPRHPSAHLEEITFDYKPDASTIEVGYSTGTDIYTGRPRKFKIEADEESHLTLNGQRIEPEAVVKKILEPILFPTNRP